MQNVFERFPDELRLSLFDSERRKRLLAMGREHWAPLRGLLERLPTPEALRERSGEIRCGLNQAVVEIGSAADFNVDEHRILTDAIWKLMPWRKGPFRFFGHDLDTEWRSDMKWDRIEPHVPTLDGMRVADVGCSNGYYLLRMLGLAQQRMEQPELLLGLDPSESFYFAFDLLRRYIDAPALASEPLGVEHLSMFPAFFDVVLCMGIVYHQRDPLRSIQELKAALRPGGRLILESQVIPGSEPVALFPPGRYAKAHNVFFIPTPACLMAWVDRAGFQNVEIVSVERVTPEEQRRTELAPYESLSDFLSPENPELTVEGHPAPHRAVIVAE